MERATKARRHEGRVGNPLCLVAAWPYVLVRQSAGRYRKGMRFDIRFVPGAGEDLEVVR